MSKQSYSRRSRKEEKPVSRTGRSDGRSGASRKKKKYKPVSSRRASRTILYAGLLSAVLFIIHVLYSLTNAYPFFEILMGCIALAVIGIAIAVRNLGGRHLQRLTAFFLCFFLITFFGLQIYMLGGYRSIPKLEGKFVVEVMGARCYGWEPGKSLKGRLDKALELLNEYPDAVCIVSGGKGANERVDEARVMRKYLTDNGIYPERILIEDQAADTLENVRFSREILEKNGLGDLPVVAVSGAYHLPRVQLLHLLYDCGPAYGLGSYSDNVFSWTAYSVREYMATVKFTADYVFSLIGGTE